MNDNVIEIVNNDYIFEIIDNSYEIIAENVISIDYNAAINIPSINNVVLKGNKTLSELGIQTSGSYADTDLSNLSDTGQFILNNKANIDLSNLSSAGETHFANLSLSNLNASGQDLFNNKSNIDLSNLSAVGEEHFLNPSLSNLNSTGQAVIDAKADVATTLSGYGITDGVNVDCGNLSRSGKQNIGMLAMPSQLATTYTVGASGAQYRADYAGYVVACVASAGNCYVYLENTAKNGFSIYNTSTASGITVFAMLPVSVYDTFTFSYFSCSVSSLILYKIGGNY